ncbi:hypothetical protein RUND412_001911 [Rhizina undulata]
MEIAKSLVKCVARAFYETKHILVLDALMIHNAVRDDELAKLLGFQTKDLHKLCGKLKEDRMLAVHTRPEQKEGQQRPVNRTYYYVEFRATIDAVKFRMHGVVKEVEKKMNKDADTKGYVCPTCQKRFAMLDAVSLETDEEGMFMCDRCNTNLIDDDDSAEVKTSQERLGRLMEQMKKIIDLLKKIDDVVVPLNDFDTAINNSVPVPRDKNQLLSIPTGGKPVSSSRSNIAQTSFEISFTSTSEKTAAELAADAAKKQAQAEKNALPVWHTQSTVDPNSITTAGAKEAAERAAREADGLGLAAKIKEEEDKKAQTAEGSNGGVQADAIAQYYAALAAQKAQEEADEEDEDEDEDDDEDEDEEFEDVAGSAVTSNGATPAGSAITSKTDPKMDDSDDDSASGSAQKKVKLAEPIGEIEEEDSDEEADFEDVQ